MKRIYIDYLNDILEAITDIETFLKDQNYHLFENDHMRRNAVVRSLEIIGEATKNIPDDVRSRNVDLPWKRMAGMRDKLIHGYFGVDYESVWAVAIERLPEIKPLIQKMIDEAKNGPDA